MHDWWEGRKKYPQVIKVSDNSHRKWRWELNAEFAEDLYEKISFSTMLLYQKRDALSERSIC